jgi:N-acetylneuraminic acid mutarotase
MSWTDSIGNLWLFGGVGLDSTFGGALNDLWKFDSTNWTWVSGSNLANKYGVYGTKELAAAGNVPGGREEAVSWTDSSGNLWLFGGGGVNGLLNDLWKFDSSNWAWMSGSNTSYQRGVYGIKREEAGNMPGSRSGSVSWADSHGNLWLFGGSGLDSAGNSGLLNDLWRYQP